VCQRNIRKLAARCKHEQFRVSKEFKQTAFNESLTEEKESRQGERIQRHSSKVPIRCMQAFLSFQVIKSVYNRNEQVRLRCVLSQIDSMQEMKRVNRMDGWRKPKNP